MNDPEYDRPEKNILPDSHNRDAIIENLQAAFGMSREEFEELIQGEHFDHQY